MIKKGLLFLLLLAATLARAETIRTDVLVIGGTPGGTAAAIQSARSKLKTLLIEKGSFLGGQIVAGKQGIINGNKNLPSGIWGEFRKQVVKYYSGNKSYGLAADSSLRFEPYTAGGILKKMADTVKNLTVKFNTTYTGVKKDGTGWEVAITQGNQVFTVKARVLVDATPVSEIAKSVTDAGTPVTGLVKLITGDVYHTRQQPADLYRTAIAVCDVASVNSSLPPFSIPLAALVIKGADNLIVTGAAVSIDDALKEPLTDPAVQMCIGQGAGTIAAYCAFYKTTTKSFNVKTVRTIQGELLDFKGSLLPLADISAADASLRAIQQIAATGLLKTINAKNEKTGQLQMMFMPDTLVRTAEIQPGLNEIYTRAFLWFNRNKTGTYFTTADLLSFISEITLRDPKLFQLDMQKQWQTVYGFKSTYDLKKPLTRREFAVLANKFLHPFARYIDITGRLVN